MTQFLNANFARSTLAGSIAPGDTSLSVQAGDGALFASPTGGIVTVLVLANAATPNAPPFEIVWAHTRSGDAFTSLTRGAEGTTAQSWPAGSIVSNRITAAQVGPGSSEIAQWVFTSGSYHLINNDTGPFSYLSIQTPSITLPSSSSTGRFALHLQSILAGGMVNSGTSTNDVDWYPNFGGSTPPTGWTTGYQYGDIYAQVNEGSVKLLYGDNGKQYIVGKIGLGTTWEHGGWAGTNPGGTGVSTRTWAAGATITLNHSCALANTEAFPILTGVNVVGTLIITAVAA